MKTIKSKKKVYNPVTGTYYYVHERKTEPDDKPIKGCWDWKKKNKP